jgi:putative ABC transport system permease protein
MLKAYILTSWRHLLRNKTYAVINILGLSLGIACGILIFVLIRYHLSFDRFHAETDRIYRVNTEFHSDGVSRNGAVPGPLGKAVRNDYAFAEKVAMVVTYNSTLLSLPKEKRVKKFEEQKGIAFAETGFFDIFHFPLVQGSYLNSPNSALVTQHIAKKYFGTEDAVGKVIRYNNKTDFVVKGILKDIPPNTDRTQEIYLSYDNFKDYNAWMASDSSWGGVYSGCHCFLRLRPGVTQAQAERSLQSLSKKYYDGDDVATFQFKLQPLTDIHFNTDLDGYVDKRYLWAIGFVGLFLIITASVNFINLATAQALNRSREIGVRKVLGSEPIHVFWQFMAETALISFFALLVGLGLAWAGLPAINKLLHANMTLFTSWSLAGFLALTLVLVVFLAGSYPGLVLARFPPALALKGKLNQSHIGGFSLRRVLVVLQFSISQLLIIGTLVIARQIYFSEHTDLGFRKDGIVSLALPNDDPVKMRTLRNRLLDIPGVEKVSLCFHPPASGSNSNTDILFENRPKNETWNINIKMADDQYVPMFGLKLVAGRNIFPSDTANGYVLNETAVRKLHAGTPLDVIGKQLDINGVKSRIVGVVNDFNNYSFRGEIAPIAIYSSIDSYRECVLRIDMNKVKPILSATERIWNDMYPEYVYSQSFLDERVAQFYELDDVMLKLIETFAGIAIFIGCLGLYGLVSFMAVRKTKEIGVRKVLGAGMTQILWLFGKEFTRLLLIAFLIAAPIAGWCMYHYLESFKYRITLGWAVFVPALAGTFLIAALTVGYRSWKAAAMRPVKSLRSE